MLLEFRVSNFRSFAGEAVLSLVASKDDTLESTNVAVTGNAAVPRVLRTAVLYGANASGKSNLIKALWYMRGVVHESVIRDPNQPYRVQPFRLGKSSSESVTSFEVSLITGGVRYQYGFEMTPQRIVAEWLLSFESRKATKLFERSVDLETGKEHYRFSPKLSKLKTSWREATRSNALFLTTAVAFNSEQLRPVYSWFIESLVVITEGAVMTGDLSNRQIESGPGKEGIRSFLSVADTGISDVRTVQKKAQHKQVHVDFQKDRAEFVSMDQDVIEPEFGHAGEEGTVYFEFNDESLGTRKLYVMSGPLLDIINKGKVLVFDELDSSLHPLLMRKIVETFHQDTESYPAAQLIFSTHDTSLLDQTLFRRDQIWITEKRANHASDLIPLSDFAVRKGEALERGYLGGRYGGVPILDPRPLTGHRRGS